MWDLVLLGDQVDNACYETLFLRTKTPLIKNFLTDDGTKTRLPPFELTNELQILLGSQRVIILN